MLLCLVTDRHRLCPGASANAAIQGLLEQAGCAVEAEIDLLQVREPDLSALELANLVRRLVSLSRRTRTRIIVNDRVDVALACHADGVHLRGDSCSADHVRQITPAAFMIGRSVHAIAEAAAAGPVDYLIAGTVFASQSKPGTTGASLLGVAGLTAIVRATKVPVLAIGGITQGEVPGVAASGAAGIAAIGLFASATASSPGCGATPLTALVADVRGSFDTPPEAF